MSITLTVTTVRKGLSQQQLDDLLVAYTTDITLSKRVDIDKLVATGSSECKTKEHGYVIETSVRINK